LLYLEYSSLSVELYAFELDIFVITKFIKTIFLAC